MAHLFKRGKRYHLKYYVNGRQKEKALGTDSYQVARELQRRFESGMASGNASPLPGRTPIADVLQAYIQHVRAIKTDKSAQTDVYYLREAFGPVCDALTITSRRTTEASLSTVRPRKRGNIGSDKQTRRAKAPIVEASHFEAITTAQIAAFIDFKVREQGVSPKTANHYRSIIRRLFNWATEHHNITLPGGINPAAKMRPYKE